MSIEALENEVALKSLIALAQEIVAQKKENGDSDEVQDKVQELFGRMCTDFDTEELIGAADSPQFDRALQETRDHVFRPDGINWSYADSEYKKYREATQSKIDQSLEWPPLLPTVAILINLARYILRHGVHVNMRHPYVLKGAQYGGNGWCEFYNVYGTLVRQA